VNAKDTHEASRLVSASYQLRDMLAHRSDRYLSCELTDSEPRLSALLPDSVAREVVGAALGIVQARLARLGVSMEWREPEGT